MAENKKKRHGETDRKGSHAKNARTTTEFGDTVFCPHCIKNILLPVDNEDPGKFLSYHQRHCTAKSPRKRVVSEEPVGLEEFEARLDTSRGTKAADRESEWQDIAEDFDGAILNAGETPQKTFGFSIENKQFCRLAIPLEALKWCIQYAKFKKIELVYKISTSMF
jgi:hypothetical protein